MNIAGTTESDLRGGRKLDMPEFVFESDEEAQSDRTNLGLWGSLSGLAIGSKLLSTAGAAAMPPSAFASAWTQVTLTRADSLLGEHWAADVVPAARWRPIQRTSGTADNSESATKIMVRATIERIFRQHADDVFEVGFESEFERRILVLVEQHPGATIDALDIALYASHPFALIAEALRAVGRRPDILSSADPFLLLLHGLSHRSPDVRDSAALALCDLGDKRAIEPLRAAANRETSGLMKRNLEQVAEELAAL